MGEVVNVLVAFAVIVFIFRWVTTSTLTSFIPGNPLFLHNFVLYQAMKLQNNDQQRTLWASGQKMWRKKWCVWSFLRFYSISRIVWGSHALLFRTRIFWCKCLFFWNFFFGRLTRYPICFRIFLRKFSIQFLARRGRISPTIIVLFIFYRDNIRYDLLRTGHVGRTTEKILERGFLDAVRIHDIHPSITRVAEK